MSTVRTEKVNRSEAMKAAWARRKAAQGQPMKSQAIDKPLKRSIVDVVKELESKQETQPAGAMAVDSDLVLRAPPVERRGQPVEKFKQNDSLTSDDVCRLVEVCAAKGVSTLSFQGLSLTFKKRSDVPKASGLPASLPLRGSQASTRRSELIGLSELASEAIENLKVTDPAAYESFVQSGDVDEGDGS